MNDIFNQAESFDRDVSTWDTSKVSNMSKIFTGATSFNGDVSKWDTSKVTNMNVSLDFVPRSIFSLTTCY